MAGPGLRGMWIGGQWDWTRKGLVSNLDEWVVLVPEKLCTEVWGVGWCIFED